MKECRGTKNRNKKEGGYRLLVSRQNIQSETSKNVIPTVRGSLEKEKKCTKSVYVLPFPN